MNSSNDDLEDYVEKFRNIFYKQEDYNINKNDSWSLIDNLTSELEMSKDREDCLKKSLTTYLESENVDVTTKLVSLREKSEALENENATLKTTLDDLQIQTTADAQSRKNGYLRDITELEERYKHQLNNSKEQCERDRVRYEEKERKLYDELQLAQASAALQCDEIESNLQRQLVDANAKLRNSQNTIRNLQIDVNNLRNQLASQQIHSYHRPPKPEIQFRPLPINTTKSNRPVKSFDEPEPEDEDFETPPVASAVPLNRSATALNMNNTQHLNTPRVFRGSSAVSTKSVTSQVNKAKKKRKLYDPNNFDESNIPMF